MKNNIFVSKKNNKKKMLLISIITTVFLSYTLTKYIVTYLRDATLEISKKKVEYENDVIFKKAYSEKLKSNINSSDLISITQNKNGEILIVDFKVDKCEKLLFSVVEKMDEELLRITNYGYPYNIKVGAISNNPLLANLGPEIPVKIDLNDVALGNINTKITEFGLNNALVEIYMNIEIKVRYSLPLKSEQKTLKYSSLISSKIIEGRVPEFYSGGIKKESDIFNLPIN